MPQRLVATAGVGVVVRMPLQLVQQQVAHQVVAVPGVLGFATHVAAAGVFLSHQAVVLHVVHHLQHGGRVHGLQQQKRQHHPAQPRHQRAKQEQRHAPGLEVVILGVPNVHALFVQALLLQRPGRLPASRNRARQKGPEAFAQAGAGRVFGCGHAFVVAAVVLHKKVAVHTGRQSDLGQPPVQAFFFVAQLMRCADAHAVDGAHREHQSDVAHPGQWLRDRHPSPQDRAHHLHGHIGPHQDAVKHIPVELRHGRFGRVAEIFAKNPVEQGEPNVDDEWGQQHAPPHTRPNGGQHRAREDQWDSGAEQPPPPLVLPRLFVRERRRAHLRTLKQRTRSTSMKPCTMRVLLFRAIVNGRRLGSPRPEPLYWQHSALSGHSWNLTT